MSRPATSTSTYEEPMTCRAAPATSAARGRLELRSVRGGVQVRLTLPGPAFARCPGPPRGAAPTAARVLVRTVKASAFRGERTRVTLAREARVKQNGWVRSYRMQAVVTLARR